MYTRSVIYTILDLISHEISVSKILLYTHCTKIMKFKFDIYMQLQTFPLDSV